MSLLSSPEFDRRSFTAPLLEESLAQLVFQNESSREDALTRAIHPDDLETTLKGRGF